MQSQHLHGFQLFMQQTGRIYQKEQRPALLPKKLFTCFSIPRKTSLKFASRKRRTSSIAKEHQTHGASSTRQARPDKRYLA